MKIAFPTDDGQSINQHFGQVQAYLIITLDDNDAEVSREMRPKPGHHHAHGEPHTHNHSHRGMFAPLEDCQVFIGGGMGIPAYEAAKQTGMEIILTPNPAINEVLALYRQGLLAHNAKMAHRPGMHRH